MNDPLPDGARRLRVVNRSRFPRRVYTVGSEPDPRFTLANERTFLAWIRTAIALVAGGVALEALALPLHPRLRLIASLLLLALGLTVPILAWLTWAHVERALRQGGPLPGFGIAVPVVLGIAAVAGLILIGILTR